MGRGGEGFYYKKEEKRGSKGEILNPTSVEIRLRGKKS